MQLLLNVEKHRLSTSETAIARLWVLNDGTEILALDRRLLVGPNPAPDNPLGAPFPVSVEPVFEREEQNVIALNPGCFYGRQSQFAGLPAGRVKFHGYVLRRASSSLRADGPAEPAALLVAAQPAIVTVVAHRR